MGVEWEKNGGGRLGILRFKRKNNQKNLKNKQTKIQLKITSVPFGRKFIFIYLLLKEYFLF